MTQRLQQPCTLAESDHADSGGLRVELHKQPTRCRNLGRQNRVAQISRGRPSETKSADADLPSGETGRAWSIRLSRIGQIKAGVLIRTAGGSVHEETIYIWQPRRLAASPTAHSHRLLRY